MHMHLQLCLLLPPLPNTQKTRAPAAGTFPAGRARAGAWLLPCRCRSLLTAPAPPTWAVCIAGRHFERVWKLEPRLGSTPSWAACMAGRQFERVWKLGPHSGREPTWAARGMHCSMLG
eukprot:355550-Chlamydomonas_euryale.AAC.10